MKRFACFVVVAGFAARCLAADSVVVFNEINYHPFTNEAANEWVELHNQMAIDIDLSAWAITGDVGFKFPEATIIPGGGYLVVASDPAALQATTGMTNVVGPFSGRLNNSAGTLRLRDRNDRLMDFLEYRDGGKWPTAPDGSGATLAKLDEDSTSAPPEHWGSSVRVGGTPGTKNFPVAPVPQRRSLISFNSLWRFEASGTDLGTAWRDPAFDDSSWSGRNSATLLGYWKFDGDAAATRGAAGSLVGGVTAAADRNGVAGGALAFSGASSYVSVPGGGGLNAAPAGTISLWVKWTGAQDADCCGTFGAVLARQSNGQFSDDIIALNGSDPATARVVWRQAGGPAPVLITGTTAVGAGWRHVVVTFSATGSALYLDGVLQGTGAGASLDNNSATPLSIGAWASDGGGFMTGSIDDVAIWDQPLSGAQISQLFAQTKSPLDFAAPETAVYYAGDGRLTSNDDLRRTALPLGPRTYYFRNTFQFGDDPTRTTLKLDLAVDDGAVFYLNGSEIYRHNMPAGPVSYSTLAASAIGDATLISGITLPATNLVIGTNTLAVEVHQAVVGDAGMVFGAGLSAIATPLIVGPPPEDFVLGTLVFNEITAASSNTFQIELINTGTNVVDTAGYIIARTGVSSDAQYTLGAQTVPPGGFLVLNQAAVGFGAAPGDKLSLILPARRGVADSLEVHQRARARSPDGIGGWMTPSVITPGTSNVIALHNDVVINELMYHAPPTLEVAATVATNTIIPFTNLWRYDQSGADLGTAWRSPAYDDSAWSMGAGLFYFTANNLPAPKNTPLVLGPTTYYFRTAFNYTGAPAILSMNVRHITDDGIVLYLNGNEILRFNMPVGTIGYTNNASLSVINATARGPVPVAATNLVLGTNVLAAEIHQAANSGNDVAFGIEVTAAIEAVPRVPYSTSPEQWVELFNRSSNAVSLAGWRLDEAVDFRFGSNTIIAPGGYLVAARDPASLLARFPGISVVGPYTNTLPHRDANIVLKDDADNIADVVHYYDDGRWPQTPDAGGASLELRDPHADNAAGEAWAGSVESSRSSWRTYSYRGIAAPSAVGPDGQWHEFVIGLLDAGEVLLDDISVIESPSTAPVQLIQNGTFDAGTNKWRIIGNHHGEVIDDPDQPGNKVLRLVATGSTEHMSNHGETTLVTNRDIVNGLEYQISFRAKWISGSRQFHTRLYFNRMAHTTLLDAPSRHGTPGSQNSTFTPNLGPTYTALSHNPIVPAPFAPVTISVQAYDPDNIASMVLWWRTDGGAWLSSPMALDAQRPALNSPGYSTYAATIPGKLAGTIIQFYIEGTDGLGARSTFPASGTNSRALYQVDDGLAATNGLHNVRLVALAADTADMLRTVNLMSNDRFGCTMIYDEREVFYDIGMHLKGSEHSRTTTPRLGFNIAFSSEHLFRGVHTTVALDRSESTGFGQREMLVHQMLNHSGGVPTKYHDLVQVMAPRPEYTGSAELQLARYSDVFLDDQYDHGSDGTVYEYELVYQLNPPTDNGTPEGNKVPAPDSVMGTAIRNLGDDKEGYRWDFLIKNNEDKDDYSRIIQFCKTVELTGTNFLSQITNYIEIDQWLRCAAVNMLSGCGDSYGGDGAQHNVQFYVRPSDNKVLYFPHDMDAFFSATRGIVPNTELSKLITDPAFARTYYGHALDVIGTTYNGTYMTRWANLFKRLLPAQDFAGHLAFIVQRAAYVTSQINSAVPSASFRITSNGGNGFTTTNDTVTLTGSAPLGVKEIQVNGVSYPVTWTSTTAWSLRVPVLNGVNALAVQGIDFHGAVLTNALASLAITNVGAGALLPVVINEWMAENTAPNGFPDPLDGLFQDWFELFNPNGTVVNLSGFYLTDTLSQPAKWQIPAGTMIDPHGFLLVWADNQPAQNSGSNGQLHAAFQLSSSGEAIGLYSPAGVLQHAVVFGPQVQNVSQGLFPDGNTNGFYFMTNWTPGAANSLAAAALRVAGAITNGVFTLTWGSTPGQSYRVEFKDALTNPTWSILRTSAPALGTRMIQLDAATNGGRFYRVVEGF